MTERVNISALLRLWLTVITIMSGVAVGSASELSDTLHAKIYFRKGVSSYEPSWRSNGAAVERLLQSLPEGAQVSRVSIQSGYSPEGSLSVNRRLGRRRAQTALGLLSGLSGMESAEIITMCAPASVSRSGGERYADMRVAHISLIYTVGSETPRSSADSEPAVTSEIQEPADSSYYKASDFYKASDGIIISDEAVAAENTGEAPRSWQAMAGVKTNLLYDAAAVPNLGIELSLPHGWSLGLSGMYAWWSRPSRMRYWRLQGGELTVRKYLGDSPLTGHHVGIYAQLLRYDFCVGSTGRLSGGSGTRMFNHPTIGVGAEYGYSLRLHRRLRLDFSLGVGYLTGRYQVYRNQDGHNVWQSTRNRRWFGPTRAEASLVWILGKGGEL